MAGHSQGGGSVLSAQALEPSYGAGGDLALVIPFAPGWAIARDANGYRYPGLPTSFGAGAPAAIASIFLYAWAANTLGPTHVGDVFGAASRDAIVAALERDCVFDLAVSIPLAAPTYGDLLDDTLRSGVVSCADGGTCTGTAQTLWDWLGANPVHGDPSGAAVLVYTGTFDTLATPADVSCIVDYLRADGVSPALCVDASTHFDVVENGSAYAIEYAEAMLTAHPLPPCPSSGSLPACL
jgi:hypothetical protein